MNIYFYNNNKRILIDDTSNELILKIEEDNNMEILQANCENVSGTTQSGLGLELQNSGTCSGLLITDTKLSDGRVLNILSTLRYSTVNGTYSSTVYIQQYHNGSWEHKVNFTKSKTGSSGNIYHNIQIHIFDKNSTEYTIIKQVDDIGKGENVSATWYKSGDYRLFFEAGGPTGGKVIQKNTAVFIKK